MAATLRVAGCFEPGIYSASVQLAPTGVRYQWLVGQDKRPEELMIFLLALDPIQNYQTMRIGVFGGSFDPVHFGHLRLAACCQQQRRLDRVWFVPAASAPHKQDHDQTSGSIRAEMLDLAIADHESFEVCQIELDRGGVSYTVETLAEIQRMRPKAELFLLLGADTLEDLPNWREPAEICRLATPVVVRRPGCAELDFEPLSRFLSRERVEEIRHSQVSMPACDISSTQVRDKVAHGESIADLVPQPVAQAIERNGLYR